jgi:hypothetical protein
MAGKEKFKIARADGSGSSFETLLNPATYTTKASLDMDCDSKPQGPEALELPELVFDGTGVVPSSEGLTVAQQIGALEAVIFNPSSQAGSDTFVLRPVVVLTWGSLRFTGRVTGLEVSYTLFAPNGAPLRAKVKLGFAAQEGQVKAMVAAKDDAAPKGVVRIAAPDTSLPQLCFKAFGDPGLAYAVARANDLDSVRSVPAGTQLVYSPY